MTERTTPRATILLAAVWVVSIALWMQFGVVRPDGAGYLVYLPSTWLDRDLLFFNEWARLGMIPDGVILHKDVTSTDHLGNHWAVGTAVAWYPAFLVGDALQNATTFPRNGFSLPYNVAIVFSSAVAGLLTLIAGLRAASIHASTFASAVAVIGAWFGTPLLWYSLVHGTMSHAMSALACALVFAAALRLRRDGDRTTIFLAGLAAGFAFAVRPQNAPFALVPPLLDRRALSLPYAAGLALGMLPQLVVSTFLYGSPLGSITGGAGAKTPFAMFERIWLWEPLLSWYHGLVPWTPFAAIGIAGIVLLFRRDPRLATACMLMFVTQWLINATLERSFWGAYAFGQRRFDNLTIVFIIGAAVAVERMGRIAGTAVVGAASVWTMSIFLAARQGLDLGAYYTPGELLARQLEAVRNADLTPFSAIPEHARATVAAVIAVCGIAAILIALAFRAASMRARAVVAIAYFAAMSLFFTICGVRGAERIEAYRPLIERNRVLAKARGGADARFGLLRDELIYLRKSGRVEEAKRTERELRALIEAAR